MALTITVAVNTATHAATLTVTGGTPDYVVDAQPSGQRPAYRVRTGWSLITGDLSGRVGVDGEIPLNTPVQYIVTDATGAQAQSAVITTTSDVPLLSDALDPGRVVPIVVVSQKPNRWEGRSVWFDVLGQREPFAAIAPMRLRNGELILYAETRTDRIGLANIIPSGNPLVLRSSCIDAVDDMVLLPMRVEEELTNPDVPAGSTAFRIEYQAVSRELGPVAIDPGRTYTTVLAEAATYADLLALYATYDALRIGDPGAGLGPEAIANGSFASGGASWSATWTTAPLVPDYTLGTALWVAPPDATSRSGVITNLPRSQPLDPAVTSLRVSGRVRSTSPVTTCRVQLLTNDAPGLADYGQAGVSVGDVVIVAAGAAWATFVVDIPVPAPGDTVWSVVFRADGLTQGAQVEWDDLSARWRTP